MNTTTAPAEETAHSSLYNKRLPKFEGPRSAEQALTDDMRVKKSAADVASKKEAKPELDLEGQVDDVLRCVGSQNSLREIFYKMLEYCQEVRDYSELEAFILNSDEMVYSHIIQSPDSLMNMLSKHHGVTKTPFDADGAEVTDERIDGLTKDEIDDLIATYHFETTEAGRMVVELLAPAKRFAAQLAQNRGRLETFYAILAFIDETPRKFPEIKEFYKEHDEFEKGTASDSQQLAPDFYVDKLEKAGMLIWKGHWEVSEDGKSALAAYRAAN